MLKTNKNDILILVYKGDKKPMITKIKPIIKYFYTFIILIIIYILLGVLRGGTATSAMYEAGFTRNYRIYNYQLLQQAPLFPAIHRDLIKRILTFIKQN